MAKLKGKIICCSRESNFDVKRIDQISRVFLQSFTCTFSVKQFYFQSRAIYFTFSATDDFCWMKQSFCHEKIFPVELLVNLDGLVIPKSGESVSVLKLLQFPTVSNLYSLMFNC